MSGSIDREESYPMVAGGRNSFPSEPANSPGLVHIVPGSAFLEFGSTTIKLYVSRSDTDSADGVAKEALVKETKVPWSLGYDVFQTGRIRPETIERCVRSLRDFQRRFPDVPFSSATAVGTAALREAANTQDLQAAIQEALGLKIQIIEGGIEAFLLETSFRDAVESFPTGLFDLGGGSLELVQYLSPGTTKKTSLPLGAVRLHCQLEHNRDPLAYEEAGRRLATHRILQELNGQIPPYSELVGTGGTVRTIVRLVGRQIFTAEDVEQLVHEELRGDLGDELEPHRQKVFLAGLVIIGSLFSTLELERVIYKSASVKLGLIDLAGSTNGQR